MHGLSVEIDPQALLKYKKFSVAPVRSAMHRLSVETDPQAVLKYKKF
jgi:hypothetical protein